MILIAKHVQQMWSQKNAHISCLSWQFKNIWLSRQRNHEEILQLIGFPLNILSEFQILYREASCQIYHNWGYTNSFTLRQGLPCGLFNCSWTYSLLSTYIWYVTFSLIEAFNFDSNLMVEYFTCQGWKLRQISK